MLALVPPPLVRTLAEPLADLVHHPPRARPLEEDRHGCLLDLVDDLQHDQHGEHLRLEHGHVLEVEGDVEEGEEGVDELEEDEFGDDEALELLLGAVVLPVGKVVGQVEVVLVACMVKTS